MASDRQRAEMIMHRAMEAAVSSDVGHWRKLWDYAEEQLRAVAAETRAAWEVTADQAEQRGREAALEWAAQRLEARAEEIKHTSHRDGLGMGFQALEQALLADAAAIRRGPQEVSDG